MKFKVSKNYAVKNYMHEIFDSTNPLPNQLLTEASLYRVAMGHDDKGYVIISAEKNIILDNNGEPLTGEALLAENNRRTKELKNTLKKLGYSYIPVFGGYKYKDSEKTEYEKSFIVYPYDVVNNEEKDFDTFVSDMKELASEDNFNQESILIKAPNDKARYWNTQSKDFDIEFDGIKMNDVAQQYFTSLARRKNTTDKSSSPQRFSYVESYLNPEPCSLSERRMRHYNREIMNPIVSK